MKKTNDNESSPSFGKTENGKCIEIIEPFIHLVYHKWQTQPDNSVSYNLGIYKSDRYIDSEHKKDAIDLLELRKEKLKRINDTDH